MLESARLVSIIREVEEKEIISIIEGLVEEGIRWFEISLSDGENGMWQDCISGLQEEEFLPEKAVPGSGDDVLFPA